MEAVRQSLKKITGILFFLFLFSCITVSGVAATTAKPAVRRSELSPTGTMDLTDVAAKNKKLVVWLSELTPATVVDLKGSQNSFVLKVPIPDRWQIQQAVLHLSYVNSSTLLANKSKLVIRLNGYVQEQITLQPQSPTGEIDVALPPRLFRQAYNDLEIFVAQSNVDRCTDPVAPDLWTTLELYDSYIAFDYNRKKVPMSLSAVNSFLFDPKLVGTNLLHIVVEDLSEDNLYLAGIVASGVAIRFQYRPVHFTLSSDIREGMDNVVIGSKAFLTQLLQDSSPSVVAAIIGILPVPKEVEVYENDELVRKTVPDPTCGLICISGTTREEITRAAHAFSLLSYPLPDAKYTRVGDLIVPEVSRYAGRARIAPGDRYVIRDLGFSTTTFRGFRPGSKDFTFRIPSDLLLKPNEHAVLSVHLAYGSEMRQDSVVNINLNGNFVGAIPLDDKNGGRFQGYRITFPAYLLNRGHNTITFEPVLTPLETGECIFLQTENLRATIYDDSWIELPPMNHWIAMPEMALLFQDGFPFAKWPDWRETTVIVAEKNAETAAAAINLLAMVSQKNGIQPFEVRIGYQAGPHTGRDLLVVGPISALPEDLLRDSPISPDTPYPFFGELPTVKTAQSWWKRLEERIFHTEDSRFPEPQAVTARVKMKTALGAGRLLLTEFQSPYDNARTVLLVSAEKKKDLERGVLALWKPSVQSKCKDNLVIIESEGADCNVYTQRVGKTYHVGEIGPFSRLDYLSHNHPLLFFGTLLLSLVVLAYILYRVLKRFKAKRVKHG